MRVCMVYELIVMVKMEEVGPMGLRRIKQVSRM